LQRQASSDELFAGECEFAGHVTHVAAPEMTVYLPATHTPHVPPFGPAVPALQVQSTRSLLAAGEVDNVGHARQVLSWIAPMFVENLPLEHSVHEGGLGPINVLKVPATH